MSGVLVLREQINHFGRGLWNSPSCVASGKGTLEKNLPNSDCNRERPALDLTYPVSQPKLIGLIRIDDTRGLVASNDDEPPFVLSAD